MLLNPDTRVRSQSLANLVGFMDANPNAGIAGSMLEDEAGVVQGAAHRFPSPLGELERGARIGFVTRLLKSYVSCIPPADQAHRCEWVSGASMIVRREVFSQIGRMDDKFFLYFEEVDFCHRAVKAGWEVWVVPDSRIIHMEGQSTGIREAHRRRPRYWYESRRRFFLKAYGIWGLICADTLWAVGRTLRTIVRCICPERPRVNDPKLFVFDLLWGDFLAVVTGRTTAIRT
jgi:GT2 family glycosyltransferase